MICNVYTTTEYVTFDPDRFILASRVQHDDLVGAVQDVLGKLVDACTVGSAVRLHFVRRSTDDTSATIPLMDPATPQAVEWVRDQYRDAADPLHFLPEKFTMYQLRMLHCAIFGPDEVALKDKFRRQKIDLVKPTGEFAQALGRPAELFARAE